MNRPPESSTEPDSRRYDNRVYYEDQSSWVPSDFHRLYVYLHRLIQYVGPTPGMQSSPGSYAAKIQAKRNGVRDAELASLDLERMSPETRHLLKHMLIRQQRFDIALEEFPNLHGLSDLAELGHPIVITVDPPIPDSYFAEHGIYL